MLGKRIMGGLLCALFLTANIAIAANEENPEPAAAETVLNAGEALETEPLQLYAASAVLMDADTGRVLYGKAEKQPMAMASTTKIMTCIIVLEQVENLEELLTVSSYAASMPKVKLYIKAGEQYRVKDLLYSLMLESHNDAAVALAEHVGRQYLGEALREKPASEFSREESKEAVAAFARLMNEKAAELGCEDTWFITPNGLDETEMVTLPDGSSAEREHHTTATDLAEIMSYCILKSPEKASFLEITQKPSYSFSENGRSFSCNNHNAFLSMMEGALSGKTGFTNKAGYCYVGSLQQEGRTYVVALLACGWPNHKSYKWSDTRELMEYGLENYHLRSLTEGKEKFCEEKLKPLPVKGGRTEILGEKAYVELEKSLDGKGLEQLLLREEEQVSVEIKLKKELTAPVVKGTVVGKICYAVEDVIYREEDIVAADSVEKISPEWCWEQVFGRFLLK